MQDFVNVKLGGLWSNKDKNGDVYYSGSFGGAFINIFKNKYKKENSKDPDYNMFVCPFVKKDADKKENKDIKNEEMPF